LDIAIRGGGHHGAGLCLVDDGLVIDLSPMKGIRVDPQAKTVSSRPAAPGAMWIMPTYAFGWLPPADFSHHRRGRLTLGGGTGNLTRSYGLDDR